MTRPVRRPLSRRTRLVCASSAAAIVWSLASAAAALPTGGVVYDSTPGSPTTFTPGSGTLDINQGGERVVIDWTTFDIANGETVTFNQGGANWIAFNRVNPSNLSTIDGNLNATGQVWLFSPGGLLFGPNAQVNTGSFVGSTAQLLDGDVAAALSSDTITFSPLAVANGADLTVSNGAAITADSGFVVLLGETIVQNGTIVSDNDAVWYGVAPGGQVDFTTTPSSAALTDGRVSAGPPLAEGQPSFTQGASGSTDAGTWAGISTPGTAQTGWTTVINVGGTIQATGVKPGSTDGVVIITGEDGVVDLSGGAVLLNTQSATISAGADVYIATGGATLGDITGYSVTVVAGGANIVGQVQASAGDVNINAGQVFVSLAGEVSAADDVYLTSAAGDVTVNGQVFGSGIFISAYDQVTIAGEVNGQVVDIDSTDGAVLIQETAYLYAGASGTPLTIDAATDVTIEYGAVVYSADDLSIHAGGDLTIGGYVYGDQMLIDADGALTLEDTGSIDGGVILIEADGDILVDGDIDGSTVINIQSHTGDVTLADDGSLDSTGITITAEGTLTTEAGSMIDGTGGTAQVYLSAYGVDGVGPAMDLSGDIDAFDLNLLTTDGSIRVRDGYLDVTNDFRIQAYGDATIDAAALIDADGTALLGVNGDLTIDGQIRGDTIRLYGGHIDTGAGYLRPNTALYVNGGYVTLGDVQLNGGLIDVNAADSLDITGFWATPYSDIYLELLTNAANGDVTLSNSIYASTITILSAGGITLTDDADINVRTYVNTTPTDQSAFFTAAGDLTIAAGAELDARGMIELTTTGAGGDISVDGFVRGSYFTFDSAGAVDLDASFNFYTLDGDAVGDINVNDGATFGYQPEIDLLTTTGDINFDADFGGRSLFLTADAGLVTIGATADIEAGQLAAGGVLHLYGYDGVTIEDGASVVSLSDMSIVGTGNDAVVTIDGLVRADGTGSNSTFAGIIFSQGDVVIGETGSVESQEAFYVGATNNVTVDGYLYSADVQTITTSGAGTLEIGATGEVRSGTSIDINGGDAVVIDGLVQSVSVSVDGPSISVGGTINSTDSNIAFGGGDLTITEDGSVDSAGSLYADMSGDVTIEGYASGSTVQIEADGDIAVNGGYINAGNTITLTSESGAISFDAEGLAYAGEDLFLTADTGIDMGGTLISQGITSLYTYGDGAILGVDGLIRAYSIAITADGGNVLIGSNAYLETDYVSSGIALYIRGSESVTVEAGAEMNVYGEANIRSTGYDGGDIDFNGDLFAYDVEFETTGDLTIGSSGQITSHGNISLLGYREPASSGDFFIDGDLSAQYGIYIANRNDGDVTFGANADVATFYMMGMRFDPGGEDGRSGSPNGLLGADGDIYIYSANSVITVAGSSIDATNGVGVDQGLVTIVANGPDIGVGVTTAGIDLSGDITAYNVVLTANNGSVRQRDGTISFTENFTADADQSFIQDGGGVIDGVNGLDHGDVDVDANGNILLLGVIEGYYVDLNTTGTEPGAIIQIAGDLYATDGITVTNLDGDILVHDSGVIHTGVPFETGSPDILLSANGTITTEAGSQIYTDPAYGAGSTITLQSSLASGLGIDLAGDIDTAGTVNIHTTANADISITGGQIQAGGDIDVRSQNQIDITGGELRAGDAVLIYADADILAGGDIYADYIAIGTYSGEGGGVYGSVIRVEGELTALTDLAIRNRVGGVEIGSTAVLVGNFSGLADGGASAIDIYGESVLTEAGSLITVGSAGGPVVGQIDIQAYDYFAGSGPAIDLSGDIDADQLFIDVGAGNDMRVRDGDISAIADLNLNVDGYFIVDDPAVISTEGDFTVFGYGGMTVDGDINADRILLNDDSADGVVIGGGLFAEEDIRIIAQSGDVQLTGGAQLLADVNNSTSGQDYNGVTINADGQLITASGSVIRIGPTGAPTGDVSLSSHGGDIGGYSSLDLSGDIEAEHLYLYTDYASIRLRDGDIVLEEDLYISSPRGFLMDAAATIDTDGYVEIRSVDQLISLGSITAGEYITLSSTGSSGGGMTVAGYLTANGDVTVSSADAGADIVLAGPTVIADADNNGTGEIDIDSAGAVVAPGNGLLQVGDGSGAPTGDVTIHAGGLDGSTTSAIDLNIDINAVTLTLDADAGSIHVGQGADFLLADDFTVDAVLDFEMDYGALIDVAGDIDITAHRVLTVDGHLDADGDVTLLLGGSGGGDLSVGGRITAGEDVDIRSHTGDIVFDGGDVYAVGGLVIDAYGSFSGDDKSVVDAGGDMSVTAGSGMTVDGDLTAEGDIRLTVTGGGGLRYDGFTAGPDDLVVSGSLTANGSVYIDNANGGDIYLDPTAAVLANADDLGTGEFVDIFSYGQVVTADGSTIAVGTGAVASGDVNILAWGTNNADYSAIDLSGDINANVLRLETTNGSIALNEGTFAGYNGVEIDSAGGFLLDDAAVATTNENFVLNAQQGITIDGRIDAGMAVFITRGGTGSHDITISGDIYADAEMIILNSGPNGDVVLNGATLLSDDDNYGTGQVEIVASGQVRAYGGGLISAGPLGSPTNLVSITAHGGDGGGYSAIDLDTDIWAGSLELDSNASIDIAGGVINVVNDLEIHAQLAFTMGDPAVINGQGDIEIIAGSSMAIDGDLFAGGDISLLLDGDFFNGFVPGPGDMTIGGAVEADGSVSIVNAEGGDIYLEAGAAIVADADSSASGDLVEIDADGQVISAGGSSIVVGAVGAPTGDVSITADGGDNASYSAIDIASDIDAQGLTLDAGAGSINLAGGQITVTEDLTIEATLDFVMDEPANIDGDGDIYISGGRTFTVEGSIQAGGDLTLRLDGANAQDMTIDRLLSAGGDIDIRNLGDGLLSFGDQTALFSGEDIVIQSYGDLSMDGFFDSAGFFSAQSLQELDFSGSLQAGTGASFTSSGDMTITGDAIVENFASLAVIGYSDVYFDGQFQSGGDITFFADNMVVNGSLQAFDDVGLNAYGGESGGGDITVGGQITTGDDIVVYADGDFTLTSTGALRADVDAGGDEALIRINAGGRVVTEGGSIMNIGSVAERTGLIEIYAYGVDTLTPGGLEAAIELSGDMGAEAVVVEAYDGSIVVSGLIEADEYIQLVAYNFFVLEDGGQIWGAMDRASPNDTSDGPILSDVSPGVSIVASDVSIDGEIRAGTADDDATIAIAAHYVDGDVTVGGADNAQLGQGFVLSNDEFQNLNADRIVIISGEGAPFGSGYDLHIADLNIDAANTSEVWFGTSENLFVNGVVTPSQAGEVDIHLGFTVLTDSISQDPGNPGALQPGEMLVDFIPENVFIAGSLGTVENPFGSVTLIVKGDILMGSIDFIDAAAADPEFDAAEESENFAPPAEGHVFIATDQLQMAAGDRILQQDTDTGPGFGGLVLGLPQQGSELIFSPDQLQGQLIGGTGGWTADFDAGPSRIELFGTFNGSPQAISGREAANVANLLDPDILLGDFYMNTCLFGSHECSSGGDVVPPFEDPTPPVHPDPSVEPGLDEVLSFFTTFPFQEPDDEEDEDEVEGEPVTGSGNEDLWTITPTQGGARP